MTEPLLLQIKQRAPDMSKSDRAIAEYILENYDKAAYMTAARIGSEVKVCEATVVRFAKKFGFDGYPQFKQAMQEMTRNRLTSLQRIEVTGSRIGDGDILNSVMNKDIDMIRATLEQTDRAQFDAAVDVLCSAKRIYVIGTRSAMAIASFMNYYLSLIFEEVTMIDPSNESEMFEQMLHIGSDDVVLGVSFPRYSRRAVKAMHFASDCKAKCIALTDSPSSPMAQYADHLLLAKSDMASIVDSLVAPLSLVNALLVATALRKKDELSERFQKLERIWDEYGVYEKSV